MPTADLDTMLRVGGWVFAAFVLTMVIALLIRGDLVIGKQHQADLAREADRNVAMDKRLDTQTALLSDQTGYLRFMVEFVKEIIAERQARPNA